MEKPEDPRDAQMPTIRDEHYRRAIERVERMPENQSGADKSWVSRAIEQGRSYFERVRQP